MIYPLQTGPAEKPFFLVIAKKLEWNIVKLDPFLTPSEATLRRVFQGGTVLSPADCTDVPRAFRATLAGAPGGSEIGIFHHGESGKNADLP